MRARDSVDERGCQVVGCPHPASVLPATALLWDLGLELELRLCPGHVQPVVAQLELGELEQELAGVRWATAEAVA